MLARWPSISQSTVASGVLVSEDIWAQLKPVATMEIPFWNGGAFLSQQVTTRCLSSSTMSTSPTAPTWYPSSHPQTTPDASLLWAFRWDARKHPSPWPQADQWGSGTPEATLTLCWGLNPYWQLAPDVASHMVVVLWQGHLLMPSGQKTVWASTDLVNNTPYHSGTSLLINMYSRETKEACESLVKGAGGLSEQNR